MNTAFATNFVYIISSVLFAFGLKFLGSPVTARRGNILSSIGMLLAVLATLFNGHIISFQWIAIGIIIGGSLGALVAFKAAMTQMPEMIALLHGCGAMASVFVDWTAYQVHGTTDLTNAITLYLSIVIGGLTVTGSGIAWGKLSENIPGKPIVFTGQKWLNTALIASIVILGVLFIMHPARYDLFLMILGLSLVFGVFIVIPIGGADMPVVISVLNSYSGIVACTTGFVIHNTLLIVVGSLVGANGMILSIIMCKAMNRSIGNVIFGAFGSVVKKAGGDEKKEAKAMSVEDAFLIIENAKSVVFIPGYGMAVAQAQHAVRELSEFLEKNGCDVKYAIHPVAGRMPGHMNVLLAEANIPYDQLLEMDAINPLMDTVDVAIIIGANDVVNPASRHDKSSPIYGMPIINADKAKTVFVLKRSMATGFAGIENELFYYENTRMIFGDAKQTIQALVAEFKSSQH
ncbi:MAG: NAD(P)(+) transhydrogenase (Re/Si-specific) subunit beta [Candidatus Omnitrophica bacterium]|nr:NAD(P)(+) transhydrogenase (Re/Si-specific) subunit beta [Candidatus Omnitrophota bacterium]MDE2009605.1 NAD(P)(+) transhydrogenase (Re/Si-specific) subunit beta [Candidatus Omnitrophota bacterium]MDE2214467.1 NAD(P)(+) transhydrogenase (Re/Si-specific) subunit beta [Candidatus Omnitrophota bacterium]MDE2231607.1 NAD(P)(+) transhydrogenase (Re/Si-specific) subunit beta [Candidatus Omnitrophota bacterium]